MESTTSAVMALEAIANMTIKPTTNKGQLLALCIAIARAELEKQARSRACLPDETTIVRREPDTLPPTTR